MNPCSKALASIKNAPNFVIAQVSGDQCGGMYTFREGDWLIRVERSKVSG